MKKKTIRSLVIVLIIVSMLALCLTGCGGADSTNAVKKAAEGFLSAFEAGDIDKISEYASEDMFEEGGDLSDINAVIDFTETTLTMLSELDIEREDISDEAFDAIESFKNTLLSEFVKSYEIQEVKEENGAGIVNCEITFGYDLDSVSSSDFGVDISGFTEQYATEHLDELIEIYNDQGEDGIIKYTINGILPDLTQMMQDHVISSEGKTAVCSLKVENIDGKWLVTEADLVG